MPDHPVNSAEPALKLKNSIIIKYYYFIIFY